MNPTPPIQSIHLAVVVTATSKTKQKGECIEHQLHSDHADFDYTVFWSEHYMEEMNGILLTM